MDHRYFCRHLFLVVAALLGLGSCQRANYSFQPVRSNAGAGVAGPAAVPAVPGAPAALIEPGATRGRFSSAARPRMLHNVAAQRRNHAAKTRPQPEPQTNTRLVRATQRKIEHHRPAPPEPVPERHRSKGIALLLALLLGTFGAHRFYLGYYGAGAAYAGLSALTVLLLTLGFLSVVFASTSYSGFLVIALVLSFLLQGWLIADIVRIITDSLKPKNGEYYPRFFQVRSSPGPEPDSTTK